MVARLTRTVEDEADEPVPSAPEISRGDHRPMLDYCATCHGRKRGDRRSDNCMACDAEADR